MYLPDESFQKEVFRRLNRLPGLSVHAKFYSRDWLINLITNRWAWALVPTKLVEPGNALAWGGGIHGNPASGPHQAPSHWTIQWNTYRPILTWPIPQDGGREGWEKNQSTKWHANSKLLQQHFAKNCKQATASRGAPARGIGPPPV